MQVAPVQAARQTTISGALPKSMVFEDRASVAAQALREDIEFLSSNQSTFTPTNRTIIIPVRADGQFLDLSKARFSFDLTHTGTALKAYLDGGAQCIIRELRIFNAQNALIEELNHYNLAACLMDQYETHPDELADKNAMEGTIRKYDRDVGFDPAYNDSLNVNQTRRYEIQLKGGWFQNRLGKLLPPKVAFRVEITLDDPNFCMSTAPAVLTACTLNYQVTNATLKIPGIAFKSMNFLQATALLYREGWYWMGKSWTHRTSTITNGTGDYPLQLDAAAHNLEAMVNVVRTQTLVSDPTKFSLSQRTIQPFSSYQATLGSRLVPPRRINLVTDVSPGGLGKLSNGLSRAVLGFDNATRIAKAAGDLDAGSVFTQDTGTLVAMNAYFKPGDVILFAPGLAGIVGFSRWRVTAVSVANTFTAYEMDGILGAETTEHAASVISFWLQTPEHKTANRFYQAIDGAIVTEAYKETKKVFQKPSLVNVEKFMQSEINNGVGVLAIDFKSFDDEPKLMSGIDTATNRQALTLSVTRTAACNANLQVDTFSIINRTFIVEAGSDSEPGLVQSVG